MPEINCKNLKKYLQELTKDQVAPVYLVYGEEFLYKQALEELLSAFMPAGEKRLNYDQIDGANENINDVIERINTYSLLAGSKIVAIIDSKIFYSHLDAPAFFEKAKAAFMIASETELYFRSMIWVCR